MSGRAPTEGHGSPKMLVERSPLPTPSTNAPELDGGGRSGLGDESGMDPRRRTDHRGGDV